MLDARENTTVFVLTSNIRHLASVLSYELLYRPGDPHHTAAA